MSMFDNIQCEYPLPDTGYPVSPGHTFQTKSLGRALDEYTITADGRLILNKVRWESVPDEERPYYGTPEWENVWAKLAGSLRTVPVGDEEVLYHGDVYFYDVFSSRDGSEEAWIEYKARFTEGGLSRIEVAKVHDRPPIKMQSRPTTTRPSDH